MAKKILITGANSYIGTSFEKWLAQVPSEYEVCTIDMIDGSWREKSFAGYDTVFHVAGIAHADTGKASEETQELYYKVNRDMTIETAKKAKAEGVRQFIFMSSIIVYGSKNAVITKDTLPKPDNFYGDSKLQADTALEKLSDSVFRIAILRPPMIYGESSKGNYLLLSKIAQKSPFFPNVNNRRSMLYVGNLCEFIRLIIDNEETGVFFPQNGEYVKTADLVSLIAEVHGKKIWISKCMNWAIFLLKFIPGKIGNTLNKAFGDLVYEMSISEYKENYQTVDFKTSVKLTENGATKHLTKIPQNAKKC